MITGKVNWRRRAIIRLTIRGPGGVSLELEFVIDTGFSEQISLPSSVIRALGLHRIRTDRIAVADGRVVLVDVFEATVLWNVQEKSVEVHQLGDTPLVGMALLHHSLMSMAIVDQGAITIAPIQ